VSYTKMQKSLAENCLFISAIILQAIKSYGLEKVLEDLRKYTDIGFLKERFDVDFDDAQLYFGLLYLLSKQSEMCEGGDNGEGERDSSENH
jgi:hypothetical protein